MQVPISVLILIFVVIGVVGLLFYNYASSYPGSEANVLPVKASLPSGNPVYRVGNSYIIPVRFSMSSDKPIGICRIDLNYISPTGQSRTSSVTLAISKTLYRTSATFADGSISLTTAVIRRPVDGELIVSFNSNGYTINSIVLYYCEYGISTRPKWSEALLIPETVLSP